MRLAACSLIVGVLLMTGSVADAQVNLPPPPPPPLGSEPPPPPPPQPRNDSGSARRRPPPAASSTTRESREPQRAEPEDPDPPAGRRHYGGRVLSLRFNPLALFIARGSVDAEWLFLPHHALVVSPHLTWEQERGSLPSNATGFTGSRSTGVGVEVGYHYWLTGASEPEGVFVGPSLLLDSTRHAPDIDRFTSYGAAIDGGYQVIIGSGFTMVAGGGILVIKAADTPAKLSPRLLFGIGWTF